MVKLKTMTPLGHASVSFISGKLVRSLSVPAVILGGVLPDIDFIFIFFNWFNQVHRVITHNVLFLLFASPVSYIIVSKGRKGPVSLSIFTGGMLHLLIDACMDNNPTNGIGLTLMWPFSDTYFSPFNLLTPSANSQGWQRPLLMLKSILPNMLFEVPFYFISLFLIMRERRSRTFA